MDQTYLYVVGWDIKGPVKIGFTKNPTKRLKQLQTAQPHKLQTFFLKSVESKKAKILEGIVHTLNKHNKINGEWFNLTAEQAIADIEFTIIRWDDHMITPSTKHASLY
jgi:hypothetical protein